MEAAVILEAFNNSEKVHGVRYMRLIADGDSSTMANLVENGPHWCKKVKKLECANHATKCLRGSLEKLVNTNSSYKGKLGLTKQKRIRLVCACRAAIRMRSNNSDKRAAASQLSKDILNSVFHIFGIHN